MSSQTVGASYMMSEGQNASYEVNRRNGFVLTLEKLDVELKAYSCNLPDINMESAEVAHGNERSQYLMKPKVDDIRAEIYDFIDKDVVSSLWTWFKQGYDPATGQVGYAAEYKRKGIIEEVDTKGKTVRTWYLQGLAMKRGPTPEENKVYDNHEAQKISLVMSCDWASLDNIQRQGPSGSASTVTGAVLP